MITLDPTDILPLYRQLYQALRARILSGALPAHARLPSVRELVQELAVSRNTVEGAFQELYAEGYVYSKPRSGYFVAPLDQELAPRPTPARPPAAPEVPPAPRPWRYDCHPAHLDPASFPVETWRRCFTQGLRGRLEQLVQYGDPQGEPELRRALARYLERSRGVSCRPEQVVVCAGLQQSLELVAQLLGPQHSVLAVEEPGYFMPRAVFANHGYTIEPVSVTEQGLDAATLAASTASVVYLTPSHQLPLGGVLPAAQRLRLIEWARSGERFLIEDDYDSELRYHGKPVAALQGLDPEGRIVYTGTFSKVLSPALRLSYLVLPPTLVPTFRDRFASYFCTVSLLEQRALTRFLEEGHWERQIRRMRTIYRRKHDRLLAALAHRFAGRARVLGEGAGLHVVLELTAPAPPAAEVLKRAAEPGALHVADGRLLPGPGAGGDQAPGGLWRAAAGGGGGRGGADR